LSIRGFVVCRLDDGDSPPANPQEILMEATLDLQTAPSSGALSRWTGRALTGLAVSFFLFDAGIKLAGHPAVAEASLRLGLPVGIAPGVGLLLLACVAVYCVPRTAVLGAVLLTGYLGGAVMVHVRVGDPLFSHTLFPVYMGACAWVGLFLRDARARRLLDPT
jgi:hypothetical protein